MAGIMNKVLELFTSEDYEDEEEASIFLFYLCISTDNQTSISNNPAQSVCSFLYTAYPLS